MTACWFCGARPAAGPAAERVNLIRDRRTGYYVVVTVRSARTTFFDIPRCWPCARFAHTTVAARFLRLACLVFAAILVVGVVVTALTDPGASIAAQLVGIAVLVAAAGLGELAIRALRPRDPRRRSSDDHPQLLAALDDGWDEGTFRG